MDVETRTRLLASMLAGRLVIVCGAGLSMAAPSSLPSAWRVASTCFDRYQSEIDPTCDPNLRNDLEALAELFARAGTLKTVFIDALVPWDLFTRPPNAGHAAVADFLLTGAAAGALSSNYDNLIERRAQDYGADFLPSLDGDQAAVRARLHAPLLKFHGCAFADRRATVWAKSQLTGDPNIAARLERSKRWMAANLREKDFLVVGFWSDWGYLNELLAEVMRGVAPQTVTVVDPSTPDELQAKAPGLWELANAENVAFRHVMGSGAEALDELRRSFSEAYLRKVLQAGRPAFEEESGVECDAGILHLPPLSSEELYTLRRDAEGVPPTSPARSREPMAAEVLGLTHLLLRAAGAIATATGYDYNGRTVRVVNGGGRILARVRGSFGEAPLTASDIVICAGAVDLGLPDSVVRAGTPGSIVRPAPTAHWMDLQTAREELAI
ncbi:SIR2 family protein [Methylobacterium sp. J-030]|uniref:SIR2 family protein n=1 Tax=Methylobacterium sp. J-030 TaxID=2836627 RepID=UPI001FBC0191|nr:SIR2 family protein [Methylobacterium sp. J-030]MCJ2067318.1 SIR2 family protein [Methylobacterium sp. J-030]